MKTLRYIIVASLLMAAMQFVSCNKDTYPQSFAPSIKTGTYSDVYRKGATIYGNISMEDFQIESFGVEYTTLSRPGLSIEQYFATAQQVPVDAVDEDGNFSVALENLDPGIIYLYRSYVNSGYTTVYGVDSSFQTPQNTEPVFGEVSIDGITYTSFAILAALADDGGGTIEQMAYIYKEVSDGEKGELTTSTPDIQTLHVKQEEGEQQYTAQIKNLRSGKTYAIRPYAVAHGMGYGDVKYVTTKVSNGTLISECDTSDVGIGSVRLQASILAHNSQYPVSRVGFCYSQESTEPTVEHLLLTATRTGDNFEAVMNNLVLDADYYIRAYAKQSDGEYIYGDVLHYTHAMPADATFLSECEVQEVMLEDYVLILELRASVLHKSSTYPIKELGFCYSTESREPTVNNLSCPAYTSDSVQFYADTWGIDPDKLYYIRAYAKQSNDEYVYGPVRSWRTGTPPVSFTLSFDGNGYYGWMDDQIFEAGVSQEITPNSFERNGYAFAGWNTARDGSGQSYADKQYIILTSDLTLYAQWQRISGTENGHEYVDLGLPSGALWATCNVGADAPHDYGNYYAWAETSTKSNYDWSTYKYGTEKALTKYGSDGKTTLDAEDDAALVNMGGRWRMPSLAQLEELRTQCSWTWTSQSGVNGYLVTSQSNGNSIFIPAAGDRNGTEGNFAASYGYYWSRSLAADASLNAANAEYLYFLAGSVGTYANHRSYGHAVRAVICEKAELSFDANGGEGTMAAQLFEVGVAQAIEANTFTRADYSFAGWNTSPDGSGTAYSDGQEITLSDNLMLYAQWESAGGSGGSGSTSGTENGYDYVDLGLPSGLKWATCNIGATTPEAYGDYFAWGETAPKNNYSWSTYKYCEGSSSTLTKYNNSASFGTVDNKTTLELADDAARANWGGKWRMPTQAEQDELRNNCTWTWITQNGINGCLITSNINGNSIFMPAGGFSSAANVNTVGSSGNYWSSTFGNEYPSAAYFLDFGSLGVSCEHYRNRTYGYLVRAVCP